MSLGWCHSVGGVVRGCGSHLIFFFTEGTLRFTPTGIFVLLITPLGGLFTPYSLTPGRVMRGHTARVICGSHQGSGGGQVVGGSHHLMSSCGVGVVVLCGGCGLDRGVTRGIKATERTPFAKEFEPIKSARCTSAPGRRGTRRPRLHSLTRGLVTSELAQRANFLFTRGATERSR